MRTVAFCEIEPFCRRVLAKHWPGIPIYEDVRSLTADRLRADGIAPDVICGGFPCQDISVAGDGVGIEGERSGLWKEYARLIGELRPLYVIVENVSALLGRGMDVVLGDLAALGFDAEWDCIPASAIGAPHDRDRVWIIAYPERQRTAVRTSSSGGEECIPNQDREHQERQIKSWSCRDAYAAADDISPRRERLVTSADIGATRSWWLRGQEDLQHIGNAPFERGDRWPQPLLRRMDDGLSGRVDRLHGIGNAVVPQIPELIGRKIMRAHA